MLKLNKNFVKNIFSESKNISQNENNDERQTKIIHCNLTQFANDRNYNHNKFIKIFLLPVFYYKKMS